MKRQPVLAVAGLVLAVMTAACGGGSDKLAQPRAVAETTTTTAAPTTTTTAAPTTTTTASPPSPEETSRMLAAADATGDWETSWALVHPDALKYTTKAQYMKDSQANAAQGVQLVSVDVKETTTVKWTFPKCPVAAFGPKVYEGTAAVSVVYHFSAPSGGAQDIPGVAHFVKGPDGHWRWFPTVGCDHKPGQAVQATP